MSNIFLIYFTFVGFLKGLVAPPLARVLLQSTAHSNLLQRVLWRTLTAGIEVT
jgi:hypothetical protein